MGYEIDFLPVGDESKSGDAITLRYGDLNGERGNQTVVVIDGGFNDTGEKVAKHLADYYKTDKIDLIISTHPDQDHINGLSYLIENLTVGELWIHQPWDHNTLLADDFADGRITDDSIKERLKESLQKAYDLVQLAAKNKVNIREPYTGLKYDERLSVLGPSLNYYTSLIPSFDGMPALKEDADASSKQSFFARAVQYIKHKAAGWGKDELDNEDTTSAKNNSSVITQLIVDDRRMLFTGDAGITALSYAADVIDKQPNVDLKFFQIPHHGSKRNLGPEILNRLIGRPVNEGQTRNISAFASSAKKGGPKHPSAKVINALTHRGVKVLATRGNAKCSPYNAPKRDGWNAAIVEDYQWEYEETE